MKKNINFVEGVQNAFYNEKGKFEIKHKRFVYYHILKKNNIVKDFEEFKKLKTITILSHLKLIECEEKINMLKLERGI